MSEAAEVNQGSCALAPLGLASIQQYVAEAGLLALMSGMMLLAMGALRLREQRRSVGWLAAGAGIGLAWVALV